MIDSDTSYAVELLELAISRIPNLTVNGVGIFDEQKVRKQQGGEAVVKRTSDGQAELRMSVDQIALCAEWIRTFMVPMKTVNRRHSSYGYKHHVEAWSAQRRNDGEVVPAYVSNGAFIAAAVGIGFRYAIDEPNVYFNFREAPITSLTPLVQRTADLRFSQSIHRPKRTSR